MGFLWISEILNSGHGAEQRYSIASLEVRLLGKCYDFDDTMPFSNVQPAWVPPLLDFLSLREKFPTMGPKPHPESIVLRILSVCPSDADYGATLLPILTSMLSPDHPFHSPKLALMVFYRFMSGWFSSQMEVVASYSLNRLIQAVDDAFHPNPDLLQDGELARTANYDSMTAVVILIEFASSETWRDHLRASNFISCEDIVSTDEGR